MSMKPSELLADSNRWCKGEVAVNELGLGINPKSDEAVKWCLVGAANKCIPDFNEFCKLIEKICEITKQNVPYFNDNPETTHEQMLEVLRKAESLAGIE